MRTVTLPVATLAAATVTLLAGAMAANATDIEISNYGVGPHGMVYAIALEKGYFEEEGLEITGIRSSPGGAATIRNMLGGNLPYAEAGVTAFIAARNAGAPIKMISGNANTVAEIMWVTMPASPVEDIHDLRGLRIGFTNPQSTTQAMAYLLLEAVGLELDDVELIATGGFGPGITALEHGGLDVAPLVEPQYSREQERYRLLAWATDILPPLANVVGITTERMIEENPEFLHGMLRARRKAVQFLKENPAEAAEIVAVHYELDVDVARNVLDNILAQDMDELQYFNEGSFHFEAMDNIIRAQRIIGALEGEVDWSDMIDESFLPEDLRSKN